jgi:hypothetical protein
MSIAPLNYSDAKTVCATLDCAANLLLQNESRFGSTHHLPTTGTVWVSGDLHDNPFNYAKIVKLADLDNPTNHVVLQELIHPTHNPETLDLSYRMLVRVAHLIGRYPAQVHPILANHELSQATDRLITKGGAELVGKFIHGVEHVFGKSSNDVLKAIHGFIRSMPLAVLSENGLMCCHSLPNEHEMPQFDTNIINRKLNKKDISAKEGSATKMVWGREHSQAQYDALANLWNVKLFCLGHAWVPAGITVLGTNVVAINSDHDQGVVLPVDLSTIQTASNVLQFAVKLSSVSMEVHEF